MMKSEYILEKEREGKKGEKEEGKKEKKREGKNLHQEKMVAITCDSYLYIYIYIY